MAVIEVSGLRKEYRHGRRRRTVALDGVDLEVPEGGGFGFHRLPLARVEYVPGVYASVLLASAAAVSRRQDVT